MTKEIKHQGKYIRFIEENTWEYVQRHNCDGVVFIVPVTKDGQLIFTEQYRLPVKSNVIEFPAGLVNDQIDCVEDVMQSARRELIEETGYDAGTLELLTEGPVSGGLTDTIVCMVLAADLKKVGDGGGVDEGEDITVHLVNWVDVDDWLLQQKFNGLMIEPKIYSGLYFLTKRLTKIS